jgi:hypothetical protein
MARPSESTNLGFSDRSSVNHGQRKRTRYKKTAFRAGSDVHCSRRAICFGGGPTSEQHAESDIPHAEARLVGGSERRTRNSLVRAIHADALAVVIDESLLATRRAPARISSTLCAARRGSAPRRDAARASLAKHVAKIHLRLEQVNRVRNMVPRPGLIRRRIALFVLKLVGQFALNFLKFKAQSYEVAPRQSMLRPGFRAAKKLRDDFVAGKTERIILSKLSGFISG